MKKPSPALAVVSEESSPEAPEKPKRRRGLMVVGPLALLVGAGAWYLLGGGYQTTDDAYLHQARIAVAASVGGRVVHVDVTENRPVKAGAALFEIDPVPYKLALDEANAAVAGARLGVEQLKAAYGQAMAQAQQSADDATYLTSERERQEALVAKGAATGSALDDARNSERHAIDQKALADQSVASALAALGGEPEIATDSHPSVQAALVARDQAAYNLANTTVKAPADGIVYQASSFKAGQMVAIGQALFALVETGDTWIDANFKETQLGDIQPGQKATVTFDQVPGHKMAAEVEAIGAGTGAEFSLLPPQNATGNWVKVTQRVPVRLRLTDPGAGQNLASGVSASVSVDTGRRRSLADLWPFGGK